MNEYLRNVALVLAIVLGTVATVAVSVLLGWLFGPWVGVAAFPVALSFFWAAAL
ncbi:MAG: hypothetical protein WC869_11870 [Phycisphaerae bacterium]|jgi:hypothetical protein